MLWSNERIAEKAKRLADWKRPMSSATAMKEMVLEMRDEYESELESVRQERTDYHVAMVAEYQNNKWRDARIAELEQAEYDTWKRGLKESGEYLSLAVRRYREIEKLEERIASYVSEIEAKDAYIDGLEARIVELENEAKGTTE